MAEPVQWHSCWAYRYAIVLGDRHAWQCVVCDHRWLVGHPAQPRKVAT